MPKVALKSVRHMSIAVIGVGRIGSTFAYQLAGAKHEVILVARPGSERFEQLKRDGGISLQSGERAKMRVTDSLDEQEAYDLVIVTTLAHQIDALLPTLRRSKARCIHFMFVNFNPESLRDAVGPDRCTFGMPAVQAMLDDEGKLSPKISKSMKTAVLRFRKHSGGGKTARRRCFMERVEGRRSRLAWRMGDCSGLGLQPLSIGKVQDELVAQFCARLHDVGLLPSPRHA